SIVGTDLLPPEQTSTVNVADVSNYISSRIGWEWARLLPGAFHAKQIKGQTAGDRFTSQVRSFLQDGIAVCQDVRKTDWKYHLEETHTRKGTKKKSAAKNPRIKASSFAQYQHLDRIRETFKDRPDLEAVFGSDYIVEPDIVVFSYPFDTDALGGRPTDSVATFSPLLTGIAVGHDLPFLHASVSCKLTIRSDRAQNARLEALNLIRTRKGRVPNIAFVTAEPLPSRIGSLALGTGDVDCIYHAGLYELVAALEATVRFSANKLPADDAPDDEKSRLLSSEPEGEEEADRAVAEATPTRGGLATQQSKLKSMIEQGRLRDISDLILDLLI
ncbi:MAG: NgoMIV family type II restriction endonuclease, partial [Candidatus Dormibacteria bacterium]